MYTLNKNQVTFNKNAKPYKLKSAQRDVREMFSWLCGIQESIPIQSTAALRAFLHKNYFNGIPMSEILEHTPTTNLSIDSAAKAFFLIKTETKTCFHMDLFVPAEQLEIVGLSPDVVAALRATGYQDFLFKAREL